VISGAEALEVTLFDGSTSPAEIVGSDPNNDVAIVRVEAPREKLYPLPLGDSKDLSVGQKVLALGNPFGLERTLTTGIISSLDRSIKSKNNRVIKGIIQTDAAINPGNSGGPLLNTRGEVIGMNTAILSSVGQSAGIGFAVPINSIKRILKPLIETGHVTRADLGVAKVFTTEQGIFIIDLDENGPAARAGLQPIQLVVERRGRYYRQRPDPDSADRIIAVDGTPVRTVDELLSAVEAHAPGDTITVTTIRHRRQREVQVTLGATD
jgi:S1-C subfamily serine protease